MPGHQLQVAQIHRASVCGVVRFQEQRAAAPVSEYGIAAGLCSEFPLHGLQIVCDALFR